MRHKAAKENVGAYKVWRRLNQEHFVKRTNEQGEGAMNQMGRRCNKDCVVESLKNADSGC